MGDYVYIVNVKGTSGEKPKDFDSNSNADNWLEYWYLKSSKPIPERCANKSCSKRITNDNKMVGAHVFTYNKFMFIYYIDKKVYIAPICNSCNIGNTNNINIFLENNIPSDIMKIDRNYLVPHPKYKNKK